MRHKQEEGFTLLEIAMAISFLAAALVVLIGLQSSVVAKALRDRNMQEAMLMSRSILAAIELDPSKVEEQDSEQPANQLFQKLLPTKEATDESEENTSRDEFMAHLVVDGITLPLREDAILEMKRVQLTIFWGDSPDNRLRTIYLVRPE
ncbi:MAG: type II secretion system protein [Bdellovibrionales bacterium]|nr:type II secretion system protein [Bdellovibrionales bacterium]